MVVDTGSRIDEMFRALADGTRRDIVRRTMSSEHSVSALARAYSMSFQAVQKHVAILERAQLVTKTRRGREQLVRGNVESIGEARAQLEAFETMWRDRIERFGAAIEEGAG